MMLELGSESNKEGCLRLLKSFFDESPYKDTEYSEDKVSKMFDSMVSDTRDSLILCYTVDDVPVGIVIGIKSEMLFSEEPVCTELVWYVLPEHRNLKIATRLIEAYEYWATEVQGSKNVVMGCLDERTSVIYKRRDYTKQEESWYRRY